MTSIDYITLHSPAPDAAAEFYAKAFPLAARVRFRASDAPISGFRGFTVSLTVAQPSVVTGLIESAVAAGATRLKPVAKSMWGVGGVVQAPDGTIWKVATTVKKDAGSLPLEINDLIVLLGATDVAASKKFYVDHGFTVGKSFGKYVE